MDLAEIKAKFDALNADDWEGQAEFFANTFGPLLEHAIRLEAERDRYYATGVSLHSAAQEALNARRKAEAEVERLKALISGYRKAVEQESGAALARRDLFGALNGR